MTYSRTILRRLAAPLLAVLLVAEPTLGAEPAKVLFGAVSTPAPGAAQSIGSYAKGCLAGGAALPINGPAWQVMRLSRNRNWGQPVLVSFLERLAATVAKEDNWPGLLVGDMSQPRGGPMSSGHASHQIGLDADIWLLPMPDHILSNKERETLSAVSMLKPGTRTIDPKVWSEPRARVIRRAALAPEVDRIFVHPAIKQAMCQINWRDRGFLSKIRPWWGHDAHFHVRLTCPSGDAACVAQAAPPPGDGCGDDLAWWLTDAPWKPQDPPPKPAPPLQVADLPKACAAVLGVR